MLTKSYWRQTQINIFHQRITQYADNLEKRIFGILKLYKVLLMVLSRNSVLASFRPHFIKIICVTWSPTESEN